MLVSAIEFISVVLVVFSASTILTMEILIKLNEEDKEDGA